jgi:hypothetical protein
MPTLTVHYDTDVERLELERAHAYLADMAAVRKAAPHGTIFDACERFALDRGRALLRDNLATTLHAVADNEKKGLATASAAPAPAT